MLEHLLLWQSDIPEHSLLSDELDQDLHPQNQPYAGLPHAAAAMSAAASIDAAMHPSHNGSVSAASSHSQWTLEVQETGGTTSAVIPHDIPGASTVSGLLSSSPPSITRQPRDDDVSHLALNASFLTEELGDAGLEFLGGMQGLRELRLEDADGVSDRGWSMCVHWVVVYNGWTRLWCMTSGH
jgi:hypothetical protein